MPLSTVCVSTVSSRPRAWSSYSNIRAKDVQVLASMNSAEELTKYRENVDSSYYSPTLSKRLLGYGYDLPPEKSPKKDKKWSLGNLFRRKKKEETESSTEEDVQKRGFLSRKKKKSEKKKKSPKHVGTFDHVVLSRNSHLYSNGLNNSYEEVAIFSDPSGGFNGYAGRNLPKTPLQESAKKPIKNSRESFDNINNSRASLSTGTPDSVTKKSRKVLTKVRAEARRVNLKHDTSSDEDSQRSASSSRFRSDESLGPLRKEGSIHRRSRAARTERYLKRHSKDGENPGDYIRLSKSDIENTALQWRNSDDSRSLSRSPLVTPSKPKPPKTSYTNLSQSPSISGLSTIPPSHGSHSRIRVSNSTSNPSYKPPLSMNEYNHTTRKLPNDYLDNHRSLSCDANIHKSQSAEIGAEIYHVQFPLGKPNNRYRNLSLIDARQVDSAYAREPPPPPPRDPRRLVTAQYYENVRPSTFYFDSSGQMRSKSFNTQLNPSPQTKRPYNLHPNYRSTSEDHLPKSNIQLIPRPSSATPEASANQRYVQRHPTNPESYNYLTDKKPRSRKPIFIQTNAKSVDSSNTQKALDFWKQKDREGFNNFPERLKPKRAEPRSPRSPQMFTCQTHVQTQVFLPSVLQTDINSQHLINSNDSLAVNEPLRPSSRPSSRAGSRAGSRASSRASSPFKPIASPTQRSLVDDLKDEDLKRKSSNLEEALDELEAIYNSLRLGDEDLLERAEQREKDAAANKLKQQKLFPDWSTSRGALSDSSFCYEPFDSVDSPRRKRFIRKSQTVDRRADDMAYRKLNKERASTINDPQSMVAKVSYLHASPLYGRDDYDVPNKNPKEPDVTFDDVVYRTVKFANSNPKVVEPQPPFGIPIGPITLASNSDYLHAVPNNVQRPTFKPRKIPDLVKDDLAFRNLRKDDGKEPALPPLSPEDLKNNNSCEGKPDSFKKKRAVRSLSANIGSLINRDILSRGLEKYKHNNNSENESKTLTDIADAMEIARQVLREKENKISATKKAFLSDTDTNNGNSDIMAESRMNFLNSLKVPSEGLAATRVSDHAKPPRGSPFDEKLSSQNESRDSSLDELLTALATEARETNERITSELKDLAGEKRPLPIDENLNQQLCKTLSDIDAVSEQAKLCEKLLEGVVDSTDLMASAPLEQVEQISVEPVLMESVANIVLTRDDSKNEKKPVEKACESDHDYENLISDQELNLEEDEIKCRSPFEEHKAELIASFQELKKNVDLDIGEARSVSETDNKENSETVAGEECVGVLDPASSLEECAYVSNKQTNCDTTLDSPTNQTCSSDVDSSSGFHSNSSEPAPSLDSFGQTNLDSLESLKSPKLVLESAKLSKGDASKRILENQSMISRDPCVPGTSSDTDCTRTREPGHILDDDEKPTLAWHRDPATLAVACSYGVACAHQLASLDFVAILGILFAVLSFIAALFF